MRRDGCNLTWVRRCALRARGARLACARRRADTFDDPGFATEVVATVPPYTLVGLAFAPDGRLFVWQKNGVVRIIKNGVLLPTPFVDLSSHVNTFDDRGMWGLTFDPDFANNGYVYVTYTYENAGNPNDAGPEDRPADADHRQSDQPRRRSPGRDLIMGSIGTPPCSAHPAGADCIPSDGGSHTIGEVHFAARRNAAPRGRRRRRRRRRRSAPAPRAEPQFRQREDPPHQQGRHRTDGQPVLRRHELDPLEGVALRRS